MVWQKQSFLVGSTLIAMAIAVAGLTSVGWSLSALLVMVPVLGFILFLRPIWGVYLLGGAIPFQLYPMTFFSVDPIQHARYTFSLTQVLVDALFLVTVVRIIVRGRFRFAPSYLNLMVILFVMSFVLSSLRSPDLDTLWRFLIPRVLDIVLLYFVVTNNVSSREQIQRLVVIFLLSSTAIGLFGLAQYRGGNEAIVEFQQSNWAVLFNGPGYVEARLVNIPSQAQLPYTRIISIFVIALSYAGFLLYPLFISFGFFLYSKSQILKLSSGLLAGLMAVNLVMTFSRGAWIGAVVGLLSIYLLAGRRLVLLSFGALLLMMAILLSESFVGFHFDGLPLGGGVATRIEETFSPESDTGAERLDLWRRSLELSINHPIIGAGTFHELGYEGKTAHNQYIDIFRHSGIVGLFFFVALSGMAIYRLRRVLRYSSDDYARGLALGLLGALVAVFFHSMFWSDLLFYQNGMSFFLLLGLSAVLDAQVASKKAKVMVPTVVGLNRGVVLAANLLFAITLVTIVIVFSVGPLDIISYLLGIFALMLTFTGFMIRSHIDPA